MSDNRITMKLSTSLFFDRKSVQNAHDRSVIDALKETGAAIRKIARRSMKYKPKRRRTPTGSRRKRRRRSTYNASPGMPPHRHVRLNQFGIHTIQFVKDPARPVVIVGPITNRVRTAPPTEALEYGGTTPVRGQRKRKQTTSAGKAGERPVKVVRVAARPFMNPALRAASKSMGKYYKDAVGKRFKGTVPRAYRVRKFTTKVDV